MLDKLSNNFKMIKCTFLCLSVLNFGALCEKAPFIKPCRLNDGACLFQSGQAALPFIAKGIPSLGVPPADPLIINDVRADSGDLQLGFRNMKVVGVNKCRMTTLESSGERSFHLVLECPIVANGQYTLGGKLLFIPAEGDGDFEIKTDNIRIIVDFVTVDVTDATGTKHWKIASHQSSYEPVEKFFIRLDNLFNGDNKRAEPVLKILDHGWKELITEIGKPIILAAIDKAVNSVEKFFEATPSEELTI